MTHDFIMGLRRKLRDELAFAEVDNENVILSAFDRAALATVLNGSESKKRGVAAGSPEARARAKKAAATRAKRANGGGDAEIGA